MSSGLHVNNILGVGTARHVHSLLQSPHDLDIVDMPMGPCVLRWHFSEQRRVFMKQLHADGITNLLRAPHRPDVICTTSYGGEFRFWHADEYTPLTSAVHVSVTNHVTRSTPIMHASWSSEGRYLALSSFHHGIEPGADLTQERNYSFISVYDLSQGLDQPKLVAQQCGIFDGLCEWHQTDTCQVLVIAENRPVTQWHEDVTSIDGEIPLLHVWRSDSWQLTSTRAASRPISGMIYDKSRAQVIVAHIDRTLSIWQVSNELAVSHVRTSGTLPGSGRVLCPAVLSHSHVIVAPSEQGLYYSVPVDHVPADVKPSVTHVTPGLVYTLVQSIVDKCHLWICNDSGIHRAKFSITNSESVPQLKIEQLQSITCFDLACCGLDICRANGNHVAVGDLTGRVLVWDISQSTPKKAINTEAMIRSLTWWHEHELQYGTLSGEIYTWSVNSELAPQHVTNVTGGVTCLAWDPISQSVLAASTTEGQVYLLSRDQQGAWHQIGLIEARDQQPYVSSREIWSVAWSPCGNFLATGGEDRMTHIHRVQRVTGVKLAPKPEHVLHEKSAAVTCLDWQRDSKDRAVLAVSSDDCTVHCWELRDSVPVVLDVLRTDRRQLMITYCALEQRGTRLFCGTMGGSVWHCHVTQSDSTTAHVRPHFGSVEGLRAMSLPNLGITRVVTCASDLTVQITDYPIM